jgi:hypothetical protein
MQLSLFHSRAAREYPAAIPLPAEPVAEELRAEELQPTNGHQVEPELSPEERARLPLQPALFDKGEWWHDYWKGMPEFVQEDLAPVKTIYVHFETRDDYLAFAKLVGQTLTMNTRSIWYPEAEIGRTFNKRYIDAPPPETDDELELIEVEVE